MPITICKSSKATPQKALDYIFDDEKMLTSGTQRLLRSDPEGISNQMMRTMKIHGKGSGADERKYYHTKVSFDPADLTENGGELTAEKANEYATTYAAAIWPGHEVAWAVQQHEPGSPMHVHFITAACNQETGRKIDARNSEYRKWKHTANDIAGEMGLSTIDWEKAVAKKRSKENQPQMPINETFAEKGLKARGKATWKDELRGIIDVALQESRNMNQFKAALEAQGVTLTRLTDQTISYKLGDHQACRGDTLGGDYTRSAVDDAIRNNKARSLNASDRQELRENGRSAGVKRSDVDQWADEAKRNKQDVAATVLQKNNSEKWRADTKKKKSPYMKALQHKEGEAVALQKWKDEENRWRLMYNQTLAKMIENGDLTREQAIEVTERMYEARRAEREQIKYHKELYWRYLQDEYSKEAADWEEYQRRRYVNQYLIYDEDGKRRPLCEVLLIVIMELIKAWYYDFQSWHEEKNRVEPIYVDVKIDVEQLWQIKHFEKTIGGVFEAMDLDSPITEKRRQETPAEVRVYRIEREIRNIDDAYKKLFTEEIETERQLVQSYALLRRSGENSHQGLAEERAFLSKMHAITGLCFEDIFDFNDYWGDLEDRYFMAKELAEEKLKEAQGEIEAQKHETLEEVIGTAVKERAEKAAGVMTLYHDGKSRRGSIDPDAR